jgi:pyrroloquinoline quinone biosynthesis protein B
MKMIVLGAAAGGGFPQWNSNAEGCRRARSGDPAAKPRTQASLAVSADGESWFLLNASPDLRQQIEHNPQLHPRIGLRSSPIAGVVLNCGEVDAIAGLLTLRERQPFTVYATQGVLAILRANPIFDVLAADIVTRIAVTPGEPVALERTDGSSSGLSVTLFPVPGKTPLYLETPGAEPPITVSEDTVAIEVTDGRSRACFVPACAAMSDDLRSRLNGADVAFFDGTLWSDDEMIRAGLGHKTGRRMGHISVGGPGGTIAAFRDIDVKRKILIHINNSNPILLEDSAERAAVEAAGWEVAFDGMAVAP